MKLSSSFKKVALMAIISSSAFAVGCKHNSPEERIEKMSKRIASKLDFNEQQKSMLDQLAAEIKSDFAAEAPYRETLKEEFKKQVNATEIDQAKVVQLIRERKARMDARLEKYVAKVAEIHKTLTPEQKAEILSKFERFSKHME